MAIPALLSKKTGAPVMMRISREEEHYIGRARPACWPRARSASARTAASPRSISSSSRTTGPYGTDGRSSTRRRQCRSLIYQPLRDALARRRRCSPTRRRATQQRSPGPMQANAIMEPVVTKAAKQLGLDQVAIRRINAPEGKALFGPPGKDGQRSHVTSAFVKEALDRGAELFNWDERKARSGKRRGSKVRGVGVAVGPHRRRIDRLRRPDDDSARRQAVRAVGRRQPRHALGDRSRARRRRRARDAVGQGRGRSGATPARTCPWTCMSVGSQTTHAMTRANHAGAMDAKRKLQEIAATDLGGAPDDYELGDERVLPQRQPVAGPDLRAGGAARDRARRQVRRPRAAGRHPRDRRSVGGGARRPRADGRREGHLSARRRHLLVRRRLRRSRSRRRDRDGDARRLPRGRRRRHGRQPAQPRRADARRQLPRHRPRAARRSRSTTRTTACRWRGASTTTSR